MVLPYQQVYFLKTWCSVFLWLTAYTAYGVLNVLRITRSRRRRCEFVCSYIRMWASVCYSYQMHLKVVNKFEITEQKIKSKDENVLSRNRNRRCIRPNKNGRNDVFSSALLWDLILGIYFIGTADIVEKCQLMCVLQPERVDQSFKRHE